MLTVDRLRSVLSYNSETGEFRWLETRRRGHIGKAAGCISKQSGYVLIKIDGKLYMAHRLAWLHAHGCWPSNRTDHVNGVRSDNRLSNLREANPSQNGANRRLTERNSLGLKGVSRRYGKYRATIIKDYKQIFLGSFDSPEDAHRAYVDAAKRLYGEFARAR